ncbi:tetratricopeptide repeat protein [Virgibacillus halodenitrificans]|uniref:tetratricopeptide repeat protein n=1 Tax=Virgibacillus halodenitrificans TaxID=1482 RepID=UPI000EF4E4AE|nr:tetratricopeptide repeat protein [Virgibacillus halodenitrificans]
MGKMDIFNIEEKIKEIDDDNSKEAIQEILIEFNRNHFPNVISKAKEYRNKFQNEQLTHLLLIMEATSHAKIGEGSASIEIITRLYEEQKSPSVDDLILYSELAFMNDYKLARRIMSEAVKLMESNEINIEKIKLARAYLVLGETEENLEKYIRAIKYYKKALAHFVESKQKDLQMIQFLHFKLGVLHSTVNKPEEGENYLKKAMEIAESQQDVNVIINCMVSLAKNLGSRGENQEAFAYLKKALPMFEDSTLKNTMVHAEAYTELAFYYFDQSQLEEAVPNYENAIRIYFKLSHYSARKLGMIHMQYAYCLEHKKNPEVSKAGNKYEKAIELLESSNDRELLENALADVISFFAQKNNSKKKRLFENKFVRLTNKI